jgi:hypothetical protein
VKFIGAIVGLYALYAAFKGEVYAKSGVWGKVVLRDETPGYFWTVIVIYAGLAVALATLF